MTPWHRIIGVGLVLAGLLIAARPPAVRAADEGARPGVLISKYAGVPPLPHSGPQLRAPLSPAAEVDVDKRTTAFIPRSLNMLTPLDEMPVTEDRWIRVDLSEQMVVAYEGDLPVRAFIVSTGLPGTPTVTGTYRIRMKVRAQTMQGGDPALHTYYNLPNVQWVQYFYADYSFHGTYWHSNFGNPMSHGCINMTNADAKWLFDWAGPTWDEKSVWQAPTGDNPGTLVIVTE
jgi:lipoprotein-anchoring transpeptidase ErfK/SrfK